MEFLLNLGWLLLVLPAFQLWRGSRNATSRSRFTSTQCFLALACALVVLFPVVSATDDLHAMRAEIEDSPAGKRGVRLSTDRASGSVSKLQTPPALLVASLLQLPPAAFSEQPAPPPNSHLSSSPAGVISGRAPPSAALA
ncbi:MAG TPA: hypothetical protein VKV39_19225 [Candidatus Sulfotelmatobacter sp.]|nr:hypothetical protein [Candidatus Sulfotelmatobacter sp.]